jgi:RecA/RadA recombinase
VSVIDRGDVDNTAATGIEPLDDVLPGGLPIGAMSEMVGPECSGQTSVALSFLAQMTQAGKICCWIDVANTFDPPSAAAGGVDLTRLCSPMQVVDNSRLRYHFMIARGD